MKLYTVHVSQQNYVVSEIRTSLKFDAKEINKIKKNKIKKEIIQTCMRTLRGHPATDRTRRLSQHSTIAEMSMQYRWTKTCP